MVADVIEPDDGSFDGARRAADVVFGHISSAPDPVDGAELSAAVHKAHDALFDPAARSSSIFAVAGAVSLASLLITETEASLVTVGSCRCYRARDGRVQCLAEGHATSDPMSPPDAAAGYRRNLVSEALGLREQVQLSSSVRPVRDGDRYLLCTSAVWTSLPGNALSATLTHPGAVEHVQSALLERVPVSDGAALAIVQVAAAPSHE